jgi:hypothetical protein
VPGDSPQAASVFFPQAALDEWIVEGTVDFRDGELTLLKEGRRYRVQEAVCVISEVGGGVDEHALTGRVKLRSFLDGIGAEILETSMLVGDAAYDVTPGWLGAPTEAFAEYARACTAGGAASQNDEELLAAFLTEKAPEKAREKT